MILFLPGPSMLPGPGSRSFYGNFDRWVTVPSLPVHGPYSINKTTKLLDVWLSSGHPKGAV